MMVKRKPKRVDLSNSPVAFVDTRSEIGIGKIARLMLCPFSICLILLTRSSPVSASRMPSTFILFEIFRIILSSGKSGMSCMIEPSPPQLFVFVARNGLVFPVSCLVRS